MMYLLIFIALLFLIVIYVIQLYNQLVKGKVNVSEAWSGMDVQLKKRYDLIPNLIETVKAYMVHERETLESVTLARTSAMQAQGVENQQQAENFLARSMSGLFALAEKYPDLKANTNFLKMQEDLNAIENDIEKSRRYYNGTVRDQQVLIDSFPSNLIANGFGFKNLPFFELESSTERHVPNVSFK
jgi:LemA protein